MVAQGFSEVFDMLVEAIGSVPKYNLVTSYNHYAGGQSLICAGQARNGRPGCFHGSVLSASQDKPVFAMRTANSDRNYSWRFFFPSHDVMLEIS